MAKKLKLEPDKMAVLLATNELILDGDISPVVKKITMSLKKQVVVWREVFLDLLPT